MTPDKLTFGTDGWRDIIGDIYTFKNVSRVAQAYAQHLLEKGTPSVVIGYDTRFNGAQFAEVVAKVMAANGLEVKLSAAFLPTPALSLAVTHYGAGGGVMLTASHNPPPYNGFKLKGPYGGTATADIYEDVGSRVEKITSEEVKAFDPDSHRFETFDIRDAYFDKLAELVDVEVLRSGTGSVVHDAMGGAAAGWFGGFLRHIEAKLEVREVRSEPTPMFYGVNPEPITPNLASTMAYMKDSDAYFAAVTDGDGDRIGLVLPDGSYFNAHQIFAVLLDLMNDKGYTGRVVETFNVSRIIERLAAKRDLPVLETPIGFKHIVAAMLEGDVLIGGEESGGIGVTGYIPERDGVANGLLMLEAVLKSGHSVAELFAELERETGWQHAYDRLDVKLSGGDLKEAVMRSLEDAPSDFAKRTVQSVETLDGVKLNLGGNAWILFRPSGTEPLLRVYCEAPSDEEVRNILQAAEAWIAGQEAD